MRIINRAGLSAETLAVIESELPAHGTLLELVQWAAVQSPPLAVAAVVAQDEYTRDLLLPWRDGLTLVYGAT
ncbi:MAG: hypothetical protein U0Z53_15145 [Blastocatellia bacterium]